MVSPFYRARAYAIRDSETKERLSYRYFDKQDLPPLSRYSHTGRVVEYYITSMDRHRANKPKRGAQA